MPQQDSRPSNESASARQTVIAVAVVLLVCGTHSTVLGQAFQLRNQSRLGAIEYETQSDYSHIRVRRSRNIRTLIFVRDSGEEASESQVDVTRPHELRFPYLQHMFAHYLVDPQQLEQNSPVLIVGLGGGSMVHFLQHYAPQVPVEALEIDPVVVALAKKYFRVSDTEDDNITLHTVDAFQFLEETQKRYAVIYMDAFLKPAADTDSTGVPLRLKTKQFYQSLHPKLTENGIVVFNINSHHNLREDVATIKESFPQTYVFELPLRNGLVVAGSMNPRRQSRTELATAARKTDNTFRTRFSFQKMVRGLQSR